MSEYNKLTVAKLREVLKDRGIPSTGLTRKAQIIERLQDDDGNGGAPGAPEAAATAAEPENVKELKETQGEAGATEAAAEALQVSIEPASQTEATPPPPEGDTTANKTSPEPSTVAEPEERVSPPEEQPAPLPSPVTAPKSPALEGVNPTTHAVDFAMSAKTPSPASNEQPSVERPEPEPASEQPIGTSAQAEVEAEQSADDSSAVASQINPEELEADSRKRKRRSPSPEMPAEDIKAKKPRPSVGAPGVHLKEDGDVVMVQSIPEDVAGENEVLEEEVAKGSKDESANDVQQKENESDFAASTVSVSDAKGRPVPAESKSEAPGKKEKGARYKDLFQPAAPATSTDTVPVNRPIVPALHAATAALYIRDFMRPLRLEPLRTHLISIASPPGASPEHGIVKSLFLDSMKTHALVSFDTMAAASRVRASLHGTVWPPEGQRKELWADFIPEDKAFEWIKEEEDHIAAEKEGRLSGHPIPSKRFEVVYSVSPTTGTTEAVFQEVGSNAPLNAPKGPRSSIEHRRPSSAQQHQAITAAGVPEDTKRDIGKSFQTLDQLFESTTAKPKLYYLPVSDHVAERRIDDLKDETSRYWSPGERVRGRNAPPDLKLRYSFDADDRVVEVGGDFGPWADDSGGFRGGRGGYRGGGAGLRSERGRPYGGGFGYGAGGFRGRGGGGGWRGA